MKYILKKYDIVFHIKLFTIKPLFHCHGALFVNPSFIVAFY